MRVLWFSVTSSCYTSKSSLDFNGGGWITSLERVVRRSNNIELGIAFELDTDKTKDVIDGITYYPINVATAAYRMKSRFGHSHEESTLLPQALRIVEDFKPDIIQCFGSEWCFGLLSRMVKTPVVIHMQGSMPTYYNALYPPRYNSLSQLRFNLLHNPRMTVRGLTETRKNRQRAQREVRVLSGCKNFLGRTEWDRAIVDLFSPGASYYTCNEVLRDAFYYSERTWKRNPSAHKLRIATVGNGSLWKGIDVILKTADALKRYGEVDFEWRVVGRIGNREYIEWMEGLRFADCGVTFVGVLDEKELRDELLQADIYVHPSYIDNSPNALCEAMVLGLPCIASYVGGVPSMVTDGEDGLLVPVNEPYMLADTIKNLAADGSKMDALSAAARQRALKRHDPDAILNELTTAYTKIING